MKTLVIYYSLEGNTRFVAQRMAAAIGADMLELRPKQDIRPDGLLRFVWGGQQVMSHREPDLEPFEREPGDYDVLLIGTPVWAFTYTPALRTFLRRHAPRGKRIGLFCCHRGVPGRTLARLREALSGNTILGAIDFVEPQRRRPDRSATRAEAWARDMAEAAQGTGGGTLSPQRGLRPQRKTEDGDIIRRCV